MVSYPLLCKFWLLQCRRSLLLLPTTVYFPFQPTNLVISEPKMHLVRSILVSVNLVESKLGRMFLSTHD